MCRRRSGSSDEVMVAGLFGVTRQVVIEGGFEGWRETARRLLQVGVRPEEVRLVDVREGASGSLFGDAETPVGNADGRPVRAPAAFLERARVVACHRSGGRWDLLYRVLSRLQENRSLLQIEVDDDVAEMRRLEHQVKRDLHKMHAFVRFRRVTEDGGEHFVSWYEPDHAILAMAAPFFAERFAVMRWTILTPDGSVSWLPETKELRFGPGVRREMAPVGDDFEDLWRTYYRSIFNPARTNLSAMRSEMPVRYWKNLPEIQALPGLLTEAEGRVQGMIDREAGGTALEFVPGVHELPVLQEALGGCKGCELYRYATQPVFGRGPEGARLMLVGEQPGDEEDRRGEPFVGPAGRLLNEVLREAEIDRETVYVTNAVKHFKFKEQGKRRLHESPRLKEIVACRPWLLAEMEAVKPEVVVCLGASAAKSLLGAKFALLRERGKVMASAYAERVVATVHPSAILRATDAVRAAEMREMLLQDLRFAARLV